VYLNISACCTKKRVLFELKKINYEKKKQQFADTKLEIMRHVLKMHYNFLVA